MVLPRRPSVLRNPFRPGTPTEGRRRRRLSVRSTVVVALLLAGVGALLFVATLPRGMPPPPPSRRFPEHGADGFGERCPWILPPPPANDEGVCITYVTPHPENQEGMADWITKIVSGFFDARLRGCRLFLDYGDLNIELEEVIEPVSSDWRWWRQEHLAGRTGPPPRRLPCHPKDPTRPCVSFAERKDFNVVSRGGRDPKTIFPPSGIHIPDYRPIFHESPRSGLYEDQFQDLHQALETDGGGAGKASATIANTTAAAAAAAATVAVPPTGGWRFSLSTGFACSMSSTIRLAWQASLYQPNLFSTLLPALRAEDSFTIAVYIRTEATDRMASQEFLSQGGPQNDIDRKFFEARYPQRDEESIDFAASPDVQPVLRCLEQLEEIALGLRGSPASEPRNDPGDSVLAGVVSERLPPGLAGINWLVVSDSVPLKTWMAARYHDQPVAAAGGPSSSSSSVPRRRVWTTAARGIHTRAARKPETAEFAEAMIDWYLLGESDLVLTSSRKFTFGATASLRTAVPLVHPMGQEAEAHAACAYLPVVQEGASPTSGDSVRIVQSSRP